MHSHTPTHTHKHMLKHTHTYEHTFENATHSHTQTSVPDHKTSVTGEENQLSFEDKRKVNFEAGRLELDRRRRARQEQQERVAVSLLKSVQSYTEIEAFCVFI